MSKQLASLVIKLSANGAEAEKVLRTLEDSVGKFGKKMTSVGDAINKKVTAPLVALAGVATAAANTQLQAEARLLTALDGRADAQKRLITSARELQSRSTMSDQAIISQQAFLAALGLTEQQINSTIEAAVQLSYATGMELESAVKNLAKTYSGLTGELNESIPALKALTAEQLKAGGAVAYVNDNYKGFAESAAATGAGPMAQLKNQFVDIAEKIGTILLPMIQQITSWLSKLAEWLQGLSPALVKTIATIGAVVAALGGVLSVGGRMATMIGSLISILPRLGQALTMLVANPVGVAITAIGMLTAAIAGVKAESAAAIAQAEAETQALESKGLTTAYNNQRYRLEGLSLETIYEVYVRLRSEFDRLNESADKLDRVELHKLKLLEQQVNATVHVYHEKKKEKEAAESLQQQQEELNSLTDEEYLAKLRTARAESKRLESLNAIIDKEEQLADLARRKAEFQAGARSAGINTSFDYNVLELSSFSNGFFDLSEFTTEKTPLSKFNEWWAKGKDDAAAIAESTVEMGGILANAFSGLMTSIGEGLGDLFSGKEFNPLKLILSVLGNTLKELGEQIIAVSGVIEALKKTIGNWGLGALSIPIGVAAIVLGQAMINKANEPIKLARGGLAYAPTLAVVGDNPGASRDPEVVAPLSKLREYMGGQRLELVGNVDFVLSGDTVRAILNRENVRLSRLG